MEDLIQNVHTLFEERPPPSSTVSSLQDVPETMSPDTHGSLLLSPDYPHHAGIPAVAYSTPQEVSAPTTPSGRPVAEWRLHQSRRPPHPDAPTIPPSPPESVLSSMSDFPLSSATSLQTRMGGFSP